MPISKRTRTGEYVEWRPSSPSEPVANASEPAQDDQSEAVEQPPKKRARTTRSAPQPAAVRKQPQRGKKAADKTLAAESAPAPAPAPARGRKKGKAAAPGVSEPIAGPSQLPNPSDAAASQPAPAKGKGKAKAKKATSDAPSAEKRLAQFKSSCPQNIEQRLGRVQSQTFYMIDRNRVDGELREEFSVLGSTCNVYTVKIDHKPSCNCPDANMGNHCKHILFIFVKVLQVPIHKPYWYQKALLTSELQDIFDHAPLAPNSLAHAHVRQAFAQATGKEPSTSQAASNDKKRLPGEDDDCPICYDGMYGVPESKLEFCTTCGNALHKACFGQWQNRARATGAAVTCVWCRADWPTAGGTGGDAGAVKRSKNGYINLAGVVGGNAQRDTSSYYHGPRAGQHYRGFQNYS